MRAGTIIPALVLVTVVTAGIPAAAQTPGEQYDLAVNAFEYQDYAKVIAILTPLLEPEPKLPSAAMILKGREMLGASLWWTGDRKTAQEIFTKLIVSKPDSQLDSFYYPPELVADFGELKKKLAEAGIIQDGAAGSHPQVCTGRTVEKYDPIVNFVPFGGAQFSQGRTLAGGLFLSAEAVCLGGNVGAWAWMYSADLKGEDRDLAISLMYGSLAGLAAVYVWEVVDAFVHFEAERVVEEK